MRYAVPIERLFALIGDVGSRGLIYQAVIGGTAKMHCAIPAFALFSLIDGIAVYGVRRGWQWHGSCRRAHGTFAALGCVELLMFVIATRL